MNYHILRCCVFAVGTLLVVSVVLWLTAPLSLQEASEAELRDLHAELLNNVKEQHASNAMGSEDKHLLVFLQVSDLHLSIRGNVERKTKLIDMLKEAKTAIRPEVVLATGDLTDAIGFGLSSHQHEEEWKMYKEVVETSGLAQTAVWLDVPGNHDRFNVPQNSEQDFFKKYSVQGPKKDRSYIYVHRQRDGDETAFVALEATILPGLKRMFNFIGHVSSADLQQLHDLEVLAKSAKYTIWFGHYPRNAINAGNPGLEHLMRRSLAYLCGHFHTIFGIAPALYKRSIYGNLELELGDWKHNRRFRVLAIDNGLFSFVDVAYDGSVWPVLLVTNPKASSLLMTDREPLFLTQDSTHVRILAFSPAEVVEVSVCLPGVECVPAVRASGGSSDGPSGGPSNLWVAPWQPHQFRSGLHLMKVRASDAEGRTRSIEHFFSLDGTRTEFDFISTLILSRHLHFLYRSFVIFLLIWITFVYAFLQIFLWLVEANRVSFPTGSTFLSTFARRQLLMHSIPKLLLPTFFLPYSLICAPIIVGFVVEGHFGVTFVTGTFVQGRWVHGELSYLYYFLLLGTLIPWMNCSLSKVASRRMEALMWNEVERKRFQLSWTAGSPLAIAAVCSLVFIFVWIQYDFLTALVSPIGGWLLLYFALMWFIANSLTNEDIRRFRHLEGHSPSHLARD